MIQFNLLPEVKLQYIKAQRLKQLVISLSLLIGAGLLVIFILLFSYVDVAQKVQLNNMNNTISKDSATLKGNSNLNKILTVQNQLTTLPTLEAQLPQSSRIFGYITQVTPASATISTVSADFTQDTLTINGNANSLATVNQYVDTLEFTTYKIGNSNQGKAFSNVSLASYNYSSQTGVSYSITLSFNADLFNNADNVSLSVPQITTTRSVLDQPTDLFVKNTGGQ